MGKIIKASSKSQGRLFIISGPSGSGKTTLAAKILASSRLKNILARSISATTRKARPNEKNGRDYLFFSKKDFLSKRQKGFFLEWQKVFGQFYGTPKNRVEAILSSGKSVLLCIDVKGAKIVFKKCPQAVGIFIKTPTWEILKTRLINRGTETVNSISVRLRIARRELKEVKKYKHVVVNGKISQARREIEKIILSYLKKGR